MIPKFVTFLIYNAGELNECRFLCLILHPSSLPQHTLLPPTYSTMLYHAYKMFHAFVYLLKVSEGKSFPCSIPRSFSTLSPNIPEMRLGPQLFLCSTFPMCKVPLPSFPGIPWGREAQSRRRSSKERPAFLQGNISSIFPVEAILLLILAGFPNSACLWLSQVLGQGPRHLGADVLPFARCSPQSLLTATSALQNSASLPGPELWWKTQAKEWWNQFSPNQLLSLTSFKGAGPELPIWQTNKLTLKVVTFFLESSLSAFSSVFPCLWVHGAILWACANMFHPVPTRLLQASWCDFHRNQIVSTTRVLRLHT